jgi:hypothetical protein
MPIILGRPAFLLPLLAVACFAGLRLPGGALPPASPVANPEPPGRKIVLGTVKVDATSKVVHATGWVNMTNGVVELLACGPRGKVHESVFVMDAKAEDLQAALLLVGIPRGRFPEGGEWKPPVGSNVDILVEWSIGNNRRRVSAQETVWNVLTQAPLADTGWVFTGSMIEDGRFMAASEESFITTYWDYWAILNLPLAVGGNDGALHARSEILPPKGTPVSFEIKARGVAED